MRAKLLRKLFRGEFVPLEGRHIGTPQIEELNEKISKTREYFQTHYTEEEKNRLELYTEMLLDRSSLECEELQFDAFLLGIQVGLEIRENSMNSIRV